jgi:hypothetical protein
VLETTFPHAWFPVYLLEVSIVNQSSQDSVKNTAPTILYSLCDLFLFLVIAGAIIVKSILSEDGGSAVNDGAFYLALAQNLRDGHGYYLYDSFVAFKPTLFSTWPVGYSTLIYGVSILTNLSVFWASKVVNILCVAGSFIAFRTFFGSFVAPYGIVFLLGTVFRRSYCSLSELSFTFGLFCYCLSMSRFIDRERIVLPSVSIFLSSIFIFLMRYVGAFVLLPTIILSGLFAFQRQWKKSLTLIFISMLTLGLQASYIINNYRRTGLFTGWPRIKAQEGTYDLAVELLSRLISEANLIWSRSINFHIFLVTLALQTILVYQIYRKYKDHESTDPDVRMKDSFLFCTILVSLCYLSAFIILRFNFAMENFASRHFAPITFLVCIGFIRVLHLRLPEPVFYRAVFPRIAIICLLSFGFVLPNKYMYSKVIGDGSIKGYREIVSEITQTFEEIPNGSQVIVFDFDNTDHLHYLRSDLRLIHYPRIGPIYRESPPLENFVPQFINEEDKTVYISIVQSLDPTQYHPSVIEYMNSHKNEWLGEWPERIAPEHKMH